MATEKQIIYKSTNTYSTLNKLTSNTKNVWLVFHGMGYLSRYFLKYFKSLDPIENYIIAPQAPSKYYLGTQFKHVGSCWLTKENTIEEKKNVLSYIDAVYEVEPFNNDLNFIVLGYSQGVSIAMRWLATRKIHCSQLVLHSGGIPDELVHEDFLFQDKNTRITYLCGDADEYISEEIRNDQFAKGKELFRERFSTKVFKGRHIFYRDILDEILA